MILVSGFNVYPNEVEDVVTQMPGVLECAAVGIADEKAGEAVKLVIVRKDPPVTEAAVRAYCEANLTGYKRPKMVEFRNDLPKTPVGKILRGHVRIAAQSEPGATDAMEKTWLKQYPAGVPAEIDANQYASLVELLDESFRSTPTPAYRFMGKAISFGEVDEASRAFAA